jgi:type IV secretion system protein VirB10
MKSVLAWVLAGFVSGGCVLWAQEQPETEKYVISFGTRIPLVLVNSVSTRTSQVGDRVYLQTSFPISVSNRIVVPEGTYVTGTVTQVKRPGRIRGRGELYVRFDTLMLRNGVTRDFRGTVSAVDGAGNETLKDDEGKVEGEATKGRDAGTAASTGASGATIGAIAGGGKGAAIGAGIGAAAGLGAVLLTRGSEVRLLRGTALEMQLDRDLAFTADEINFLGSAPSSPVPPPPSAAPPAGNRSGSPVSLPGRFPLPF